MRSVAAFAIICCAPAAHAGAPFIVPADERPSGHLMLEIEASRNSTTVGSADYRSYNVAPGEAYWLVDGLHIGAWLQTNFGTVGPDGPVDPSLLGVIQAGYARQLPGWRWAVDAHAYTWVHPTPEVRATAEIHTGTIRPVVGIQHISIIGGDEGWQPFVTSLLAGAALRLANVTVFSLFDAGLVHEMGRQNTFFAPGLWMDVVRALPESFTVGARIGVARNFGRRIGGAEVDSQGLWLTLHGRCDVGD